MGIRAPWLFVGSATVLLASVSCALSVEGTSPGLAPVDEGGMDATDQGDVSVSPQGSSSGSGHDAGDASAPKDARAHDAPGDVSEDREGVDAVADSPSDATPDAEIEDGGLADATDAPADVTAGDGGPCTGGTPGCVIVPPGWSLVAFSANQGSACPGGFQNQTDLVEGPDATSACACQSCTVTQPASCATGTVSVFYDTAGPGPGAGTCGMPGSVTPLGNSPAGSCATDIYKGSYNTYDIEYVPPAATGGACTAPGTASGTVSYAAHDRSCSPASPASAGCVGDACMPSLTGTYQACITQSGDQACPAGNLGVKHTVGTASSVACSDCGCSVTAQCTGTVTLYTDNRCTQKPLAVPADGNCHNIKTLNGGANYTTAVAAYTYAGGTPTTQCAATGTSSAQSVSLTNLSTVCCAQ
jgi:hypothetical protein